MQPFIDLHFHLDGAVTVEIAKRLSVLQGIPLPTADDISLSRLLSVPPQCRNLNEFLTRFELPLTLLQTKEALAEASYLIARNLFSAGIIYAEIRFAPQLHTRKGMTQEDALQAVLEGTRRGHPHANIILCCMRGMDNDRENAETAALAHAYLVQDKGVVAMDLAGAEALYPTSKYKDLFLKAADDGIPITMHAGEAAGPDSIRQALSYCARRIGHGVRAFEDKELLSLLADRNITLEMCPTSNRQTRAIPDMGAYPLKYYLDVGIKATVNTDSVTVCNTTLKEEYEYVTSLLHLNDTDCKQLIHNAIDGAFTTESTKNMLKKRLEQETII